MSSSSMLGRHFLFVDEDLEADRLGVARSSSQLPVMMFMWGIPAK
jgi:hypothetical protein